MWPSPNAVIAGASSRQTSIASGQRGWKWQPAGGASGLGISPRTAPAASRRRGSGWGIASSSVRVYGCCGRDEHLVRRAGLDDPPEVHDGDAVGDVLDDRQVVGDEDQRHAELALEVADEVQDLGLDEHVERRDRLVGDDQVGPERQRRCDRDPLALPARELVRAGSRRGAATARRSRAARSPGGRGRPACRRRTRRAARAPCGPPASAGRASCRGSGRSAGRGGGSSFAPARPCRPRRRRTARSPPSGA